jgi:hypothetical protein
MTTRSLSIAAGAGLLVAAAMLPQQASALPGVSVGETQVRPAEVDTRGGTWVAAPFARVYSGRRGTWVRAPFVDLWVPR